MLSRDYHECDIFVMEWTTEEYTCQACPPKVVEQVLLSLSRRNPSPRLLVNQRLHLLVSHCGQCKHHPQWCTHELYYLRLLSRGGKVYVSAMERRPYFFWTYEPRCSPMITLSPIFEEETTERSWICDEEPTRVGSPKSPARII